MATGCHSPKLNYKPSTHFGKACKMCAPVLPLPWLFGGLRFSDVRKLRWDMFEEVKMKVRTTKSDAFIYVPIIGKAVKLLPIRENDTNLVLQNHNKITNRKLAEIFEIAGIKRTTTFHYTHHIFATIALTLKILKEVIMNPMGIKQENDINIYAKIVDDLVEQEIEKWETILTNSDTAPI